MLVRLARNDEVTRRLDPVTVGVEATVGANGADDGVATDSAAGGLFEEIFESEAHVLSPLFEEAKGVGVTVDAEPVGKLEFEFDVAGALPVEEGVLDGVEFLVVADGAEATVPRGVGLGAGLASPDAASANEGIAVGALGRVNGGGFEVFVGGLTDWSFFGGWFWCFGLGRWSFWLGFGGCG